MTLLHKRELLVAGMKEQFNHNGFVFYNYWWVSDIDTFSVLGIRIWKSGTPGERKTYRLYFMKTPIYECSMVDENIFEVYFVWEQVDEAFVTVEKIKKHSFRKETFNFPKNTLNACPESTKNLGTLFSDKIANHYITWM